MKFKFLVTTSLLSASLAYAQPDVAPEVAPAESKVTKKKTVKVKAVKKPVKVTAPVEVKKEVETVTTVEKTTVEPANTEVKVVAEEKVSVFPVGGGTSTSFDLWDLKGWVVQPTLILESLSSNFKFNSKSPTNSSGSIKTDTNGYGLGIITGYALHQAPVKFLLGLSSERRGSKTNFDSSGGTPSKTNTTKIGAENYIGQISIGPVAEKLEFILGGVTKFRSYETTGDLDSDYSLVSNTFFRPYFGIGYHFSENTNIAATYYTKSDRSTDDRPDQIYASEIELSGAVEVTSTMSISAILNQSRKSELNYDKGKNNKEDSRKDYLTLTLGPKVSINSSSEFDFFVSYAPPVGDGTGGVNEENYTSIMLSPKYFINLDPAKALGLEFDYSMLSGNGSSKAFDYKSNQNAYNLAVSLAVKI